MEKHVTATGWKQACVLSYLIQVDVYFQKGLWFPVSKTGNAAMQLVVFYQIHVYKPFQQVPTIEKNRQPSISLKGQDAIWLLTPKIINIW